MVLEFQDLHHCVLLSLANIGVPSFCDVNSANPNKFGVVENS